MAYYGPIPVFQVSSNSLINNTVGGLVNSTINGVVNVGLSGELGQQVTNFLGLGTAEPPKNLVSSILTPGLVSTGSEALSNALTSSILNSRALGPGGPFVAELGSSVIRGLTGNLIQGLSGLTGNQSGPTRFFPGAGQEDEDANYGSSAFNQGQVGADVVFSIRPALTAAAALAQEEIKGNAPGGVPPSIAYNTNTISNAFTPTSTLSSVLANPGYLAPIFQSDLSSNFYYLDPSSPLSLYLVSTFSKEWQNYEPLLQTSEGFEAAFASGNALMQEEAQAAGWKFTTTPGDITWETAAKVDRVQIFGTNKPPVISGTRGMRDLSISNTLIEGFTFGKSVEGKIAKLESLMNYTLTQQYVKVPVYWITASDKKYGDGNKDGGYYVMKQIKVKEELRDLSGRTTRAMVDVSFAQVPDYQVDDGRDLASKSVSGGKSILAAVSDQVDKFQREQLEAARRTAAANPRDGRNAVGTPIGSWVGSSSGNQGTP